MSDDSSAGNASSTAADRKPASGKPEPNAVLRALSVFASMKLSVVLLVILGLLTWLGTLAQIEEGLWKTQHKYFESWGLIAELPLSLWGDPLFAGEDGKPFILRIPLPGAYPVMLLLFLNLLIGGMVRLKWKVRNVGILTVHLGIALLLFAGFVKLEYSYAGGLSLFESPAGAGIPNRVYESSTFVSFHDYEIALLKEDGDMFEERVIDEVDLSAAVDNTVTISGEGLPFVVQVHNWIENCRALPKGPMGRPTTPVLDADDGGPAIYLRAQRVESQRERNTAGCYVTVITEEQQRFDGILSGAEMRPFETRRYPFVFTIAGVRYALDLRKKLYDLPFGMRLKQFIKRDHPGTMTPADFRSIVTVLDDGQEQSAQIYMNTPLRKDGFVVYQTSWGPQINGRPNGGPPWFSTFEIAENPSDKWPEYSCWVIAIGLVLHFGMKLRRFLRSSARESLTA